MGIFFNSRGTFFNIFSSREKRGILWLLPLLAVITVVIIVAGRVENSPASDDNSHFTGVENRPVYSKNDHNFSRNNYNENRQHYNRNSYSENRRNYNRNNYDKNGRNYGGNSRRTLPELRQFDPNTLTASGFEELGFSPKQAAVLVNYRTARGGFRTADDFGRSFVVSDEMMARLRPYIVINQQDRRTDGGGELLQSPAERAPQDDNMGGVNTTRGNMASAGNAAAGAVSTTAGGAKKMLDINTADSAALRTVRGIGNVLVVRILDYRTRLGGFARKEQLLEIPGMMPENFVRICEQILVDSAQIQKINANFAPADVLGKHPYVTAAMLRKLLKNRQLKGGWSSTRELVEQNIATEDQAARLDPYLVFEH